MRWLGWWWGLVWGLLKVAYYVFATTALFFWLWVYYLSTH